MCVKTCKKVIHKHICENNGKQRRVRIKNTFFACNFQTFHFTWFLQPAEFHSKNKKFCELLSSKVIKKTESKSGRKEKVNLYGKR